MTITRFAFPTAIAFGDGARTLVAELGRRGITINPAGAAPPAAPVLPASR